jgi:hypothetical protein
MNISGEGNRSLSGKGMCSVVALIYIYVTWILFFGACLLPGISYADGGGAQGYILLLIGWMGPATGHFAWFANPLIVAAQYYAKRRKNQNRANMCGIGAVGCGLSILLNDTILLDEAGSTTSFMLDAGYYVWMTSIIATLVGVRCEGIVRSTTPE